MFEFAAEGIEARDPAVQQAIGPAVFGLASVNWPGEGQPIALTGLALEGETLSLTAHGAIDGLEFDGFAEFEAPDLSVFSGLAGRPLGGHALVTLDGEMNPLTGALDIEADLSTLDLSLSIPEADAFLAGQSGISLSLRRDTDGTELRALSVQAGTAELYALGTARPGDTRLSARLTVGDLARLGEGYGGSAALDAEFGASDTGNRLRLDGTLIDLQLADLPAAGIVGGLLTGATRLRADLRNHEGATELALFTLQGPNLDLSASGTWSEAEPDVALRLERLEMAALGPAARGHLQGVAQITGRDGGRVLALTLSGDGPLASGIDALDGLIANGLTLDAQATSNADGGLVLTSARLGGTGFEIEASGQQTAAGTARFALSADLSDLARLVPGIPGRAQLTSVITRTPGADGLWRHADLLDPRG